MKQSAWIPVLAALFVAAGWVSAQDGKPSPARPLAEKSSAAPAQDGKANARQAELAAIRQTVDEFIQAFNKGDAKSVAALWTEDGEYLDDSGQAYRGRSAIEAHYARFFKEHPGKQIRILVDGLRLVGEGAAIEDGRAWLEPAPAGSPATGKYTAVHVKQGGKWLMATVRDSRVEAASLYQNLQDLEWMVGSWAGEEHGARIDVECSWVANKNFLRRMHTVTRPGEAAVSGLQVIGWNPQRRQIQSWYFAADGGHASGFWTPIENGWAVETRGMTADGVDVSAVNLVMRLDENACVWQSVRRTLDGRPLADTDEVVLKRRAAER